MKMKKLAHYSTLLTTYIFVFDNFNNTINTIETCEFLLYLYLYPPLISAIGNRQFKDL